jgi:hypothetical protein
VIGYFSIVGRKRRKQVVKYKRKPENIRIFEKATKEFPECTGTYPDCPEAVDITKDPCMHCPIFLESKHRKSYMNKRKETKK